MKTIKDFLPVRSKEHTLIQGRVPTEIADLARKIMMEKNLSWADVLTACLRSFNEENRQGSGLERSAP